MRFAAATALSLQEASPLGPTQRLSILTTLARFCWRKQEHKALALALAAGFQHQVRKKWGAYGEALLPLGFAETSLNLSRACMGPFLG